MLGSVDLASLRKMMMRSGCLSSWNVIEHLQTIVLFRAQAILSKERKFSDGARILVK